MIERSSLGLLPVEQLAQLGLPRRQRPSVVLVARVEGQEVARRLLQEGTAIVGSAPDCDLPIDDPTVSRRHVELQLRQDGILVRDTGSTNGTRFQGGKIREVLVPVGAVLGVGRATVRIERAVQPPLARLGWLAARSDAMIRTIELLANAASSPATVLIDGETGSGKEVAARAVHEASPRKAGPFEVVDCGSLPPGLAASELFGHVRGAFTGADRDRAGAFERARGGSLFLDEIGELPLELQPLLLRALERREIRRVGAQEYVQVDVRVLAATNRNLEQEAAAKRFRADLPHRLTVVRVTIPPLRERIEDIEILARTALDELGSRAEGASLSPETLAALNPLGRIATDVPGEAAESLDVSRGFGGRGVTGAFIQ